MVIVLFFYLIDTLYAERRDRSILFWKSMPVSDGATVASKLLVALVAVPLGVYLLALVSDLVFSAIIWARSGDSIISQALQSWDTGLWLRIHALMLGALLVAVLWYAPFAAYLLLVSAWARRNVFLWALLPPILLHIAERIAFGTSYLKDFIGWRFGGIWVTVGAASGLDQLEEKVKAGEAGSVREILDAIDFSVAFTTADLWLGVAAAAALIWGAVRIRRYRDDT
jgi:ABC-2 type transport system permease protein